MDPADSDPLRKAIQVQGHRNDQQDNKINIPCHHMMELMECQESVMTSMGNQLNSFVKVIQKVAPLSSSMEPEVASLLGVRQRHCHQQPLLLLSFNCPNLSVFPGTLGIAEPS